MASKTKTGLWAAMGVAALGGAAHGCWWQTPALGTTTREEAVGRWLSTKP